MTAVVHVKIESFPGQMVLSQTSLKSIIPTYIIAVTLLCVAMATPGSTLFEVCYIIGTTTTCRTPSCRP